MLLKISNLRMTLEELRQLVLDLGVRVLGQHAHLDFLLAVVVAQHLEHVVAHVDAGGLVDPTEVIRRFKTSTQFRGQMVNPLINGMRGAEHRTMVSILASGPSCPGFESQCSRIFFRGIIVDFAEVNQFDQNHLVLATGKFVILP